MQHRDYMTVLREELSHRLERVEVDVQLQIHAKRRRLAYRGLVLWQLLELLPNYVLCQR